MKRLASLLSMCMFCIMAVSQVLRSDEIQVSFVSEAPLEIISASLVDCQGILEISSNKFAFKMNLNSFQGFNNALQRIHFFENYMEVAEFPIATFSGRLLDNLPTGADSTYTVKAKGNIQIHGVEDERIIDLKISRDINGVMNFTSSFEVLLKDHNITIPRIVYHKISESINVTVSGELK